MKSNIQKYLKFWEIYKGADPNVRELYNLSVEANSGADNLSRIWDNITKKHSRLSFRDHLLYGLYQSLTRACPYSAENTLQKYFSISAVYSTQRNTDIFLTKNNVSDPQTVIVYISVLKESLGQIAFTTRNIEDFLGYSSSEVYERNINELMPKFYRERHNKILRAHVELNRTSIVNKNRQVYPRKKNGFITPANLYVSIFPYFQKQLLYLGVLRPIQTYDEFILVLPDGIVDSYSQNIAKLLNLNIDSKKRLRLKNICPELDNFHKAFNYLITHQYSKLRQLSFSKRDFSSVSTKGKNSLAQQTRSGNDHSNTSFGQSETGTRKTQDMFRDSQELSRLLLTTDLNNEKTVEELANENEFEDWQRIYDIFTSTGVPIKFSPNGDMKRTGKPSGSSQLEFITIIIEENVLNSHLRVFRLQTISVNTELQAEEEEDSFQAEDQTDAYGRDSQSPSRSEDSMLGDRSNLILRAKANKPLNMAKPFGDPTPNNNEFLNANVNEERLKPQSDLLDISGNFENLSDDREARPQSDDTLSLKNPFSSANNPYEDLSPSRIRQKLREKFESESNVNKESEVNFMTESGTRIPKKYEPFKPVSIADNNPSKGVFLLVQPTLERTLTAQSLGENKEEPVKALKLDSSDDLKLDHEEKSQDKTDLKRFFEAHKIMHLDQANNAGDRSSAQSSAQSARINAKIERAIYTTQIDRTIKTMNWIVLLYCFATIVLLIYDQVITNSNLNRLNSNVQVQKISTQRLYLIAEINRRAQLINVIERGLAPKVRQTSDDTIQSMNDLLNLSNSLNNYNNEIRLSVNKIDSTEQHRFYEDIPIKERGNMNAIRLMNTFDTCTEIINSAIQLNGILSNRPAYDNPDLVFILSNTLNSLVVKNEEVANILVDDNNISLQQIEITILILLIVIVAVAVLIFLMVTRSEIKFIRRKVVFLDSLLQNQGS